MICRAGKTGRARIGFAAEVLPWTESLSFCGDFWEGLERDGSLRWILYGEKLKYRYYVVGTALPTGRMYNTGIYFLAGPGAGYWYSLRLLYLWYHIIPER